MALSDLSQKDLLKYEKWSLFAWSRGHGLQTPKGDPLEFQHSPWLFPIYEDQSQVMAIRKSSQARISTYAILRALHFSIHPHFNNVTGAGSTTIFTQPTQTDAQKFSSSRIDPIVKQNPYLLDHVFGGTELRRVSTTPGGAARSHIHLRGTWSEKEAITVDADQLIIDEVDSSKTDVISVYDTRLIASRFGIKLYISTPSIPNYGIDVYWRMSDQREYLYKCERCNTWINPVADFWRILDEDRECFRCHSCGKVLNRAAGEWVPARPGASMRGYQITQLMMLYVPMSHLLIALRTQKPRAFANYYLGIPSDEGVGQVTREAIEQKCFLSQHQRSRQATGARRIMGVDQGDIIYCEISEICQETGRSHVVDLVSTESWDTLYQLMNQHEIECCVIDARPEIRLARRFARDFPGRVFCCEYTNIHEPVDWMGSERYFIQASRTQVLDAAAEDILAGITQLYVPKDDMIDSEKPPGWIQQWENQRRLEAETPDEVPVWREVGPDHWSHADVYRKIAESRIRRKPIQEMWVPTAGARAFGPGAPSPLSPPSRERQVPDPAESLGEPPKTALREDDVGERVSGTSPASRRQRFYRGR